MTTADWKLENNLCRCCHSEGIFTNLAEPCVDLDQKELYTEMLRDALDINLAPVVGMLCAATYTICDTCIVRLQDARNFKHQVLECERQFKDMYSRNVITVGAANPDVEVKIEIPDDNINNFKDDLLNDDGNDDNYDGACEMNFDDEDMETLEMVKKKALKADKTKKLAKKSAAKKMKKITEGEPADVPVKKKARPGPPFRLRDDDFTRDGNTYHCAVCNKTYDKYYSLRYHIKTKHYKIPKYTCSYCGKHFMTAAPLTIHKLEDHNVDERFNCNACKGTFNTKVQLRKHINIFHMLGERFKCESCDYESFSFEGLYKHKFKHKTVKDYHCKFCRKSFLRKTTLDLHERIHTGDRRKVCKVCGQAFVQKASLNYHMTKYHPEVNY